MLTVVGDLCIYILGSEIDREIGKGREIDREIERQTER